MANQPTLICVAGHDADGKSSKQILPNDGLVVIYGDESHGTNRKKHLKQVQGFETQKNPIPIAC